ncbi:MAG: amidohydrolase family protein [Thermoanaerobaculia bacterium]
MSWSRGSDGSDGPGRPILPLPALNDAEGDRIPDGLPPIVDAHVHLFPDRLFAAVWGWFDAYGWPIRYKLPTPRVIDFLLSRGISRLVALPYAHKAGIARALNDYIAAVCRENPRVIGGATVFPGEEGAEAILTDAFAAGLAVVKLHCHVQCLSPDAPELHAIYAVCARAGKPALIHAGREPASPHYKCDPHALCSVERIESVLRDHPTLKLVVPHLGADEFAAYERLVTTYDNLWLDTTMAISGYFPGPLPERLVRCRPERILYGTDFPNLPYAWDRELMVLAGMGLSEPDLAAILGGNALALYAPGTSFA